MTYAQDTTQAQAALLRNDSGIATPVTDCGCEAASIIAPFSATTEGLVPHEKLREAATPKASLIALDRPPAQPAKGYTHPASTAGSRAGGPLYWPADLTNVRPEEWALMSPKDVAEFAGKTEVWLLLEAAQKHIAELTKHLAQAPTDSELIEWLDRRGDLIPELETSVIRFPHEDADLHDPSHIRAALREAFELDHQNDEDAGAALSASTKPSEQTQTTTRHDQPHDLQALSLREAMEREAASGRPCALIVGDTRVQVTYHGVKWYHDYQKTGQRSQSLTTEEFDKVLTEALNINASERAAQAKAVNP